jgi:hypothetical protein
MSDYVFYRPAVYALYVVQFPKRLWTNRGEHESDGI